MHRLRAGGDGVLKWRAREESGARGAVRREADVRDEAYQGGAAIGEEC